MKQKLILLALVMGLTIVSQSSLSLGMGKIQVYSALNEPLQSSIDLLTNIDEELLELEVKLASSEDYQKVGLDKSFVPANILVAFDEDNPNQINVTSNGPLTEPIVSLLLDVNWSNGRILREFTILLDPPAYETVNTAPQVNNVVVESVRESVVDEPLEETSVVEAPEPEMMAGEAETVTYTNEDFVDYEETETATDVAEDEIVYNNSASEVYVEAGDTMWSIANNNKVGDLSTHQMMMAIYNKNPSAFIDNNINQLIKGSRLNMPSMDEADSIGLSEALAQVESHRQSWSPAEPEYNTFQTKEVDEPVVADVTAELDYGVQLSGSDGEGSDDGQSNSDVGMDAKAQAMEEDLYNKDAENNDLKERISELEGIVEQQQDVLEISDDGLANLESQLDNAQGEIESEAAQAVDELTDEVADGSTDLDDIWGESEQIESEPTDADQIDGSSLEVDAAVVGVNDSDLMTEDADDTLYADTEDPLIANEVDDVDTNEELEAAPVPVIQKTNSSAQQESMVDKIINWVMDNLMWVIIGLVALVVLLFIPKMLSGGVDEDEDGTSFLDDIKNRNKAEKEQQEVTMDDDDVETKMNQPLVDRDEDDVLADLDSRIEFEDKDIDTVSVNDSTIESDSSDDELTELSESGEFENLEDDEFDLDGFLNDDVKDDNKATKDHSETLADVSFDDDQNDDLDDDLGFDLDRSIDDEVEKVAGEVDELVDEVDEAVDDFIDDADDLGDEVAEELAADVLAEKAEEVKDNSEDFSFDDDEEFDFDLDEELEELSEADDEPLKSVGEDDFNDMLDISDEDSETFEIEDDEDIVKEDSIEEEIDLGLEDLMDDADAIDTKLDLAKAYIDMGDAEGAKNLLEEVISEGTEEQSVAAKKLLNDM